MSERGAPKGGDGQWNPTKPYLGLSSQNQPTTKGPRIKVYHVNKMTK